MRGPPGAAVRVFQELYPNAEPNDPESLQEYGEYFLVPELRVELDLFYGALNKEDGFLRRCRRPGVDYKDRGWRIRMAKWYYHAELFQVFDKLRLRSWEIDEVCDWWGSKAEVDEFAALHPDMVIGDDIWDGIPVAPRIGPPQAHFHEPGESRAPVPRKRSRLRRMIPRPKAICGWTELGRSQLQGVQETPHVREPPSPDVEDELVTNSVGVALNHDLRSGGRSPAFDEWFKDELDNGHLPSSMSRSMPLPTNSTTPFQVSTNTISYRATPPHSMTMPSYTQRMLSTPQVQVSMPVTVTGPSGPALRSSQIRHSSLTRYQ